MYKYLKHLIFYIINIIYLSFISIILISCSIKYEKEKEDNNNIYTANVINNNKIKGKINEIEDIDFYRIVYNKETNKDIIADIICTENDSLDIRINLYRNGKIIKIIDDTDEEKGNVGEGERIINAFFSRDELINNTAVFSIQGRFIKGFNENKSSYELRVRIMEKQNDQEGEPNDKPVFASELINTGIMKGYFSPAVNFTIPEQIMNNETDWYSFRVEGNEIKLFNISHSSVPNIDTKLSVFDELGYLIREANSHRKGESEKLTAIGLKQGKYFIKLESAESYKKNEKIGYTIKIKSMDFAGSEYEPNDNYPSANPVSFNKEIKGYFNPAGDIDWFRFSIYDPSPQVVSVKVSPAAGIDPVVQLCTVSGEPIITLDDRKVDEGEIIRNMGMRQGVYYIKMTNKDTLVDEPENNYLLLIEKKPWNEDEEFEKNDKQEFANNLIVGGLKNGFITPKEDRDFYSFILEEENNIVFELTPCILLDLAIRVYDSNGTLIKKIDNKGFEQGEKENVFLESGVYYAEIFSTNGQENSRDAYIFRIYKKSLIMN